MKILKLLLPFALIAIIFTVQSCSDDPCDSTVCLNGGICNLGICDCPTGYSGIQCENYDPCANITCLNGGLCANGICNCPTGYTGSDCGIAQTPSSFTITKVDVLDYPTNNTSGAGWDLSSGADPYITMSLGTSSNSDDNITGYVENATGNSYSLTLNPPATIGNLSSNWTIGMWDYDNPDPDDFMGGIYFQPLVYANSFPSSFTLTTNTHSFRLHVNWNF